MSKRSPDIVELVAGCTVIATPDGYTIGNPDKPIHHAEHIGDPATNLQCAKVWLEDHPVIPMVTHATNPR